MPKSDYIPRPDAAFSRWMKTLQDGLAEDGATVGVTADEQTALGQQKTAFDGKLLLAEKAALAASQTSKDKTDTRREAEQFVRALVKRIKTHPECTPALRAKLGIEGAEDTTDMTQAQPTLVANPLPRGLVEIAFNKSKADGVNIYSQRDGAGEFVFLARDTASPYVDNRPLLVAGKPEARKYRAIYVINDAETGLPSDDVNVVCQP